jgi:hypothetical protein
METKFRTNWRDSSTNVTRTFHQINNDVIFAEAKVKNIDSSGYPTNGNPELGGAKSAQVRKPLFFLFLPLVLVISYSILSNQLKSELKRLAQEIDSGLEVVHDGVKELKAKALVIHDNLDEDFTRTRGCKQPGNKEPGSC